MPISPCTKICLLDDQRRLCVGCGRTLAEIAGWGSRGDAERLAIMAELPARLAAMAHDRAPAEAL